MFSKEILYEVTVTVSDDQAFLFEKYMTEKHLSDVVATGCFISATFSKNTAREYRSTYVARDREALGRYLSEYAEQLRKDFSEHFPSIRSILREERNVIHQTNS